MKDSITNKNMVYRKPRREGEFQALHDKDSENYIDHHSENDRLAAAKGPNTTMDDETALVIHQHNKIKLTFFHQSHFRPSKTACLVIGACCLGFVLMGRQSFLPEGRPNFPLLANEIKSEQPSWLLPVERLFEKIVHLQERTTTRSPPFPQTTQRRQRRLTDIVEHSNETIDVERENVESNENNDSDESHPSNDKGGDGDGDGGKRLLYVITSSSATYDKSKDRLDDVVFPIILDAIDSFIQSNKYSVIDLYMIVSYTFTKEKRDTLISLLPSGIGFQVWDDAMPLAYASRNGKNSQTGLEELQYQGAGGKWVPQDKGMLQTGGAQLARQHRFVVKDKLPYYDFFVVFEDDMRVTQAHVQNHEEIMAELRVLRQQASSRDALNKPSNQDPKAFLYNLTEPQLARIRPGLLRVEVIPKDKSQQRIQSKLDPIPVAKTIGLQLSTNTTNPLPVEEALDPKPCCHTQHHAPTINNGNPAPKATELMAWEAGILGMAVRNIPSLGWVSMLPGPKWASPSSVPGFVATRYTAPKGSPYHGLNLNRHPRAPTSIGDPKFLAQSAGWIASPRELMELHTTLCTGGFLPPFSHANFPKDGLHRHNVEFWSGGIQMWCGFCSIQRIILLDPEHFSKHLIYHTANNKQRKLDQNRLVRVTDFLGQLYTIQQQAAGVHTSPEWSPELLPSLGPE